MTSSATNLDDKRRILKSKVPRKSYVKSSINENYTIFMHAMVFIINGECDMAASLKFNKNATEAAANLGEVKIIALEDNTGNKYTLDITTNDLKLEYTSQVGAKVSHTVNGLATALGSLLSTKDNDKSVLVDTLGEFLGSSDKAKYDGKSNQTAKAFLGGKGLEGPKGDKGDTGLKGDKGDTGPKGADGKNGTSPSAAEIAAEQALQEHVAKISIQSPEFKRAVQEEMSQPYFEPPTSDDAALNWTW